MPPAKSQLYAEKKIAPRRKPFAITASWKNTSYPNASAFIESTPDC